MYYGWRNNGVYPGGTVYFTFPKGTGGNAPAIPAGWLFFTAPKGGGTAWSGSPAWTWGLKVPTSAGPGTYNIQSPNDGTLTITVVAPPAPRVMDKVASVADMVSALGAGHDVDLAAGSYYIGSEISLPAGATIRGYNATLIRIPNGAYAERMFVPQGGFTLDGLTLANEIDFRVAPQPWYIHNHSAPAGQTTVRNCIIKDGNLVGPKAAGFLVERCVFDQGQASLGAGQVYFDNLFVGKGKFGAHPMSGYAPTGCLVASCRWQGTNRGIVLQNGDSMGNVFCDLYFEGIRGGQGNANEVILLEAGASAPISPDATHGIRDNAFLDVMVNDSAQAGVQLYGSGMHSNKFCGLDLHTDAASIYLASTGSGTVGGNEFVDIQVTGCLMLRGNVGGQTFTTLQFIDQVQRRGTQGPYANVLTDANVKFPINADATALAQSYTFTQCGVAKRDHTYVSVTNANFVLT